MFHHLLSFNIDFCTSFAVLIFIKWGSKRGFDVVDVVKRGVSEERGSNAGSFVSKRWLWKDGCVYVCSREIIYEKEGWWRIINFLDFSFWFFLQAQVTSSQIALPAIHEFVILMKHKYEKSVALFSSRSWELIIFVLISSLFFLSLITMRHNYLLFLSTFFRQLYHVSFINTTFCLP